MKRLRLSMAAAVAVPAMVAGLTACQRTEPAAVAPAPAFTPATSAEASTSLVERGRGLSLAGNCAGCHTAKGGLPYAGGVPLPTPFGTAYAGNLTPDDSTGLGRWTADDFWASLHTGRSRDGRALVPAFPYTSYTHITREDSDALFAYLRSLAPVRQANRAHELRFPFGTRLALSLWQWLSFSPADLQADAAARSALTPSQARGAYLVQGLGHCAACHAPRNAWGAPAAQASGSVMPMQGWYAPSLHPTAGQPVVPEATEELIRLLQTGQTPRATVLGPMAGVVFQSTQHWPEADLRAVADYLATLPPLSATTSATAPAPAAPAAVMEAGKALYADHCADCHGTQGEGAAPAYAALVGNATVLQPQAHNLVKLLRHGGFAPATAGNPRPYGMPPQMLSDSETAAVLSYIRQSWGNGASEVTELDVLRLR